MNIEAEKIGVSLSKEQINLFETLYHDILQANEKFNLTAIKAQEEFILKHYIDSLAGLRFLSGGDSVIDVGCGAGFPSFPLAIAKNDIKITALDSTSKKIAFLNEEAKKLNLKNLIGVAARAEDAGKGAMRESFDAAISRAVAPLPILLELLAPFVKSGGKILAYKTDESELEGAADKLKELSIKLTCTERFNMPYGKRAILIFEKEGALLEKYPRQYGQIKKKPLWEIKERSGPK